MPELSAFVKNVAQDTRYFPTLIGAVLVGLLLLFFKELSDPIKQYFVPSLVIYVVGTSFIAYLQSMLAAREALKVEAKALAWHAERERKAAAAALHEKMEQEVAAPASTDTPPTFTGTPEPVFWTMVSLHVLWLASLIWYNLHRGSL